MRHAQFKLCKALDINSGNLWREVKALNAEMESNMKIATTLAI